MPVGLTQLVTYGVSALLGGPAPAADTPAYVATNTDEVVVLAEQRASTTAFAIAFDNDAPTTAAATPSREMDIESVEGVKLSATLALPAGEGPFPGVVLVSGSGPQDRDETVFGIKPFAALSKRLTAEGVAVLRYDDRGVAKSTGDFASATSLDFADDAAAAVRAIRELPEISAVGIVGHSEGGLIAPIVAERDLVDFIVLLAGPGIDGAATLRLQQLEFAKVSGLDPQQAEAIATTADRIYEAVQNEAEADALKLDIANLILLQQGGQTVDEVPPPLAPAVDAVLKQISSPWFVTFLGLNPATYLAEIDVPVLAVFGGKDTQVEADINAAAIREAVPQDADVTVTTLPDMNHLFQRAETGQVTEYATSGEPMLPELTDLIAAWIKERV